MLEDHKEKYNEAAGLYRVELGGHGYDLPVATINDKVKIAVFDMLSSWEMSRDVIYHMIHLINKAGYEFDTVISAETKGVLLAYGVAEHYHVPMVILRKTQKIYHPEVITGAVNTYTNGENLLFLDATKIPLLQGKRVLILDDVISTSSTLQTIEGILSQVGAIIAGRAFVFAEGEAAQRDDIVYADYLPLF